MGNPALLTLLRRCGMEVPGLSSPCASCPRVCPECPAIASLRRPSSSASVSSFQSSMSSCCLFSSSSSSSSSKAMTTTCCWNGASPSSSSSSSCSFRNQNCVVRRLYSTAATSSSSSSSSTTVTIASAPSSTATATATSIVTAPTLLSIPITSASSSATSITPPVATANLVSVHKTSFYKRPLPNGQIAFTSPEGRTIFHEALNSGGMESYFALAEQFHTQNEPAYCGLGTLAMVLNALKLDPDRLWKGPWRWFSEEMLGNCCVPLEVVKTKGITSHEFRCLAKCNGAEAVLYSADKSSEMEFRQKVIETCTNATETFLVVSFSRKTLDQTGEGHFSPIGGYDAKRDLVLLMDVARFKYPSYWLPVSKLWEAMLPPDPLTNKPRGFLVLSRGNQHRSALYKVSLHNNLSWRHIVRVFIEGVAKTFTHHRPCEIGSSFQAIQILLENLPPLVSKALVTYSHSLVVETTTCDEHLAPITQLLTEISQLQLFHRVEEVMATNNPFLTSESALDLEPVYAPVCSHNDHDHSHDHNHSSTTSPRNYLTELLTMLLITCPFPTFRPLPLHVRAELRRLRNMNQMSEMLKTEIADIRQSLDALACNCDSESENSACRINADYVADCADKKNDSNASPPSSSETPTKETVVPEKLSASATSSNTSKENTHNCSRTAMPNSSRKCAGCIDISSIFATLSNTSISTPRMAL